MSNLADKIVTCLSENKFSEAVEALSDPKNEEDLKKYCWDLIPVLFNSVSKEMIDNNKILKSCSESMLEIIASKAEPEEVVLEFLDHLESADSTRFCFIMKLLVISLQRCSENRQRFIESSLVSVRSFLEEFITSSSDYISEEEYEEVLYSKLSEIVAVLNSVIDFNDFFVSIVVHKVPGYDLGEMVNIFLSRLIQLYEFFLPCGNEDQVKALNELEEKVMQLIKVLVDSPFYFLQFLMSKSIKYQNHAAKPKTVNYEDMDLRNACDNVDLNSSVESLAVYENDYIVSNLSYAVFFYSVFCADKEKYEMKVPVVYNPKFIFLSLANLSNSFFEKNFNKCIVKGLNFMGVLLNFLNGMHLGRNELFFIFHEKILTHLNTIMVYSQVESTRQLALSCFRKYIEIFDYEARYLVLFHIRPKIEHSGTLGFIITLLKKYVLDILNYNKWTSYSKYYSDVNLFAIISRYCFLTNGESTDLVQNADQLISALNMLRFLLIRDKENITGIRYFMDRIDEKFLKPLKSRIESCREFYQMKLRAFGKELPISDSSVELTINGLPLAQLSHKEQKNALFASLNAVDLIDSLLLRVLECLRKSCFLRRTVLMNYRNFTTQNDAETSDEDKSYENNIKEKILESSLPFVNKRGWSVDAVSDGAVSLGYPGVINGVFTNPSAELIDYFNRKCNHQLSENMIATVDVSQGAPNPKKFIENVVQSRLKMVIPYVEKWPQALAIMSIPTNVPIAAKTFSTLIDDICHYSGDNSVDFNWYCRRGAVSLIYKSTELYMLQDKSENFSETWKFLERRIEEAFQVNKILKANENIVGNVVEFTTATFTTLGNILRLNQKSS